MDSWRSFFVGYGDTCDFITSRFGSSRTIVTGTGTLNAYRKCIKACIYEEVAGRCQRWLASVSLHDTQNVICPKQIFIKISKTEIVLFDHLQCEQMPIYVNDAHMLTRSWKIYVYFAERVTVCHICGIIYKCIVYSRGKMVHSFQFQLQLIW